MFLILQEWMKISADRVRFRMIMRFYMMNYSTKFREIIQKNPFCFER